MKCLVCCHCDEEEINKKFAFLHLIDAANDETDENYVEYRTRVNDYAKFGQFKEMNAGELGIVNICPKCGNIRKVIKNYN